ncbi:MAG: glycosyltransferase [Mameliella sp.]|nr:glycosyltransferase [Phaeodactylibacter sp.]
MKKILIIQTPSFNPQRGGVQRITFNLGEYFSKNNYEVHYYTFSRQDEIQPKYGKLHSSDNNPDDRKSIEKLKSFLLRFRFEIIINQMPYVKGIRTVLQELNAKGLTVGCIHNSLFNFKSNAKDVIDRALPKPFNSIIGNEPLLTLVQYRHKLKHARDLKEIINSHDKLFLYTPPNHEELRHFIGDYGKESVQYMPNPINLTPALPPKEKIILHVGRINIPQKRSDLLLDFWKHAHHKLPDWTFTIVGDGPYFTQLQSELITSGLPRVQLEGYQKPDSYYEKAAIFMMPSAFEGFPNTLLEAQGYGCAPLAFNSYAALDWIVQDGKDAFLLPSFDISAMADKAIFLAENEEALKNMQETAVDNAGRFIIDQVGQMWINFFEQQVQI